MMVTDLRHFLDMTDEAPGPARKLAEYFGCVVRAATAADDGAPWVSALKCRRRLGNRLCAGHVAVSRTEPPAPIEWRCSACGDEGVISSWEDSPFDLRDPHPLTDGEPRFEVTMNDETAAALRDLQLLDMECERLVFQMRCLSDHIVLSATATELDQLIGFVAIEANHETNRSRQKRLDATLEALNEAIKYVESGPFSSSVLSIDAQMGDDRQHQGYPSGRWRILETDL
jgi:hypothetical protein